MDLQKIQSKLQKLLALSASPNEAEATAAMLKCQELMEKHGIRTIDVNKETNEVGVATSKVYGYTKKHRAWESKLAAALAEVFDAEGVIQRRADGWNIMFITTVSECAIITDLYKRLRRIISKQSKQYSNAHRGHKVSLQKSYAFGMIDTVFERLKLIYNDTTEERSLVVVKKGAIDSKMEELFGSISKQQVAPPKNRMAYIQGEVDGKHVNLSKAVKSNQQQKVCNA